MSDQYRLIIICPDKLGIVASVSAFLKAHGGWILEADQYADPVNSMFFMRYAIDSASLDLSMEDVTAAFQPIADEFNMHWRITDASRPKKALLMVSQLDHCLNDLLYRWRSGDLPMAKPAVISNHETLRSLVEWHGIPYHHVPVPKDAEGKEPAFRQTAEIIDQYQPSLFQSLNEPEIRG